MWEEVGQRGWLFLEDPTERKHEVMVHENQTYASVLDLVRTRYSVGLETAVTLTYEFPEWMKGPGDLSPPPVDVREDGDVELFMSIRIELPATRLMVTIGNDVVARYLFQRRDNYTVIGSSKGVTSDNTLLSGPSEEDLKRFKYLFLSFGASAKGYRYMRKVIVVDGTHLKGKYNGCLLSASAQDANYQIFPIAFAIVDGENDQSWGWFFQKLSSVVSDGYNLVFVSDRYQSIYARLHKVNTHFEDLHMKMFFFSEYERR